MEGDKDELESRLKNEMIIHLSFVLQVRYEFERNQDFNKMPAGNLDAPARIRRELAGADLEMDKLRRDLEMLMADARGEVSWLIFSTIQGVMLLITFLIFNFIHEFITHFSRNKLPK